MDRLIEYIYQLKVVSNLTLIINRIISMLLYLIEHAYNTYMTLAIEYILYYTNYPFNLRTNWPSNEEPNNPASGLYTH
jgi:hypothetical protein